MQAEKDPFKNIVLKGMVRRKKPTLPCWARRSARPYPPLPGNTDHIKRPGRSSDLRSGKSLLARLRGLSYGNDCCLGFAPKFPCWSAGLHCWTRVAYEIVYVVCSYQSGKHWTHFGMFTIKFSKHHPHHVGVGKGGVGGKFDDVCLLCKVCGTCQQIAPGCVAICFLSISATQIGWFRRFPLLKDSRNTSYPKRFGESSSLWTIIILLVAILPKIGRSQY